MCVKQIDNMDVKISLKPFRIHFSSMHNFEDFLIFDYFWQFWNYFPYRKYINYVIFFSAWDLDQTCQSFIAALRMLNINCDLILFFKFFNTVIKILFSFNINQWSTLNSFCFCNLMAGLNERNGIAFKITLMGMTLKYSLDSNLKNILRSFLLFAPFAFPSPYRFGLFLDSFYLGLNENFCLLKYFNLIFHLIVQCRLFSLRELPQNSCNFV